MALSGDETIYILRKTAGAVDDYGNPSHTQTSIAVANCLVGFGSTGEPVDLNRNPIDAALTLYMPAGTQVLDGDEFEIRSHVWVKDGEPVEFQVDWPGFVLGIAVSVRRRRG